MWPKRTLDNYDENQMMKDHADSLNDFLRSNFTPSTTIGEQLVESHDAIEQRIAEGENVYE